MMCVFTRADLSAGWPRNHTRAIPNIKHRSVTPAIISAFVAVFHAPGRPMAIIPNNVPSIPSQKNSSTSRLSAITAPACAGRRAL